MTMFAYFAPVTNATFPVRSGMSRDGSYVGLENKKPIVYDGTQNDMNARAKQRSSSLGRAASEKKLPM